MMGSRKELTRQGDGVEQTGLQGRPKVARPVPPEGPTWSPAVALGFLGLIIVSAMTGIITLLSVIR
jgi:hypothetical protein